MFGDHRGVWAPGALVIAGFVIASQPFPCVQPELGHLSLIYMKHVRVFVWRVCF